MHAVNLIPAEERKGAGGAAGRSGGAAYVIVGVLAVGVMLAALYGASARSVKSRRADLAQVQQQATAAEAAATSLASYPQFAALKATRVQTVTQLAGGRFDWPHALRELARVIPADAWLTTLQGTVTPGVPVKSAVGGGSSLRGDLPVPAIELGGCTTDQDAVARMMTRMRLMDGVQRVSLQSADKGAIQQGSSPSSLAGAADGGSTDCRHGQAEYPQFSIVVFYDQAVGSVPTTAVAAAGATGVTGAAGATGPAAAAVPVPVAETAP